MDTLAQIPLTLNLVNSGCVAGSNGAWTNSVATVCSIAGKFATVLATNSDQAETPTLDSNTGVAFPPILPNTCACVVFGVNAAGSPTVLAVQGTALPTEVGVTSTVGAFINAPQFPAIPNDFCPIAYTVVRCAPSLIAGFILGSTYWAASGASCTTFQNICTLPARPQIS